MLVLIKSGKMKLGFSQTGLSNPATVDELHQYIMASQRTKEKIN
jgi:hypothetical protein